MSLLRLSLLALTLGCRLGSPGLADVDIGEADLRVLFIGNSLTYTNDLPRVVELLAELEGRSLATGTLAFPNASLEDHAARDAFGVIRRQQPDVIILQQGPSSLPESRTHLVHWSQQFASVAAEHDGGTALLMVWPSSDRLNAFDAVRDSYAAAADAVDGLFIPAGESWRATWDRDESLALYAGDGFHPSPLGTLAAALTAHAVLHALDASTFTCPDPQHLGVDAEVLGTLCTAVLEAVEASRTAG